VEYLGLAARLVIGAIFVVAGVSKLRHADEFDRAVADYRVLPTSLVRPVARTLPWLEVVLGACLLLGVLIVPASVLAAAVLVAFAGGIWLNVKRERRIGCGCGFARREEVSNKLVVRNGLLTVLALVSAAIPAAALALYPGPGVAPATITPADAVGAVLATAAAAGLVLVGLEARRSRPALAASP
jgi:uncharacterized membrane protein YphA (DoxX/SURF4 family)